MKEDLNKFLDIAKEAAILAGDFLAKSVNGDFKILHNKGRDLKLQTDQDAEDLIKDHIQSKSILPILAEESGISEEPEDLFWVIDPLDGTSNYLRGIPISCVSIALMHKLEPVLGVIYDFNNNDLYFGHQESKAFVNDQAIQVSSLSLKNESTLVTGIPAKTNYSDEEFYQLISTFQAWKKIRMIGSAAMAAAYVAAGKAETYQENGIFLWDIAAGAAIVRAAGGIASISNLQSDYRVDAKFSNIQIEE
jgi:myo-inositol-1(or 4)-monophosphatase